MNSRRERRILQAAKRHKKHLRKKLERELLAAVKEQTYGVIVPEGDQVEIVKFGGATQ